MNWSELLEGGGGFFRGDDFGMRVSRCTIDVLDHVDVLSRDGVAADVVLVESVEVL